MVGDYAMIKILGYLWASPITAIGLAYVIFCQLMGWYRYLGVREHALCWATKPEKMPKWLKKIWGGKFNLAGHAIGNVIVLDAGDVDVDRPTGERYQRLLRHEMTHVLQVMKFGIFQPILYGLNYLTALMLKNSDPYYDNIFEIDARRAAGQIIDVVGLKQKIEELKSEKNESSSIK